MHGSRRMVKNGALYNCTVQLLYHVQLLPHFCHSSTSVYYTEWKWKNKKQGRPENETKESLGMSLLHTEMHELVWIICSSP